MNRRLCSYKHILAKGEKRGRRWLIQLGERGLYPRSVLVGKKTRLWVIDEVDAYYERLVAERESA